MRFTLRQIEYFVAVGEAGGIALASERLNISAPSISAAVSHLEQVFGLELLIRHHAQGVSLTPDGRRFLEEARKLLAGAAALHQLADEMGTSARGPLSIGCLVVLASTVWPTLRRSFETANPEVAVASTVAHHGILLEKLRSAELDIALTYDLDLPPDIRFEPLASLPPHALFAADHPLAAASAVGLDQLAAEPLLLLDLPFSRDYFLSLFQEAGLRPTIRERVADYEVLRSLVASNFGYGLGNIRPVMPRGPDGRGVTFVPLAGRCRPMTLGLAAARGRPAAKLIIAFEKLCRTVIATNSIPGMTLPA